MDWWWQLRFAWRRPGYAEAREFLLAHLPRGGTCVEIGVFKGEFSAAILRLNQPRRLFLIDTWSPDAIDLANFDADSICASVRDRFADAIRAGTVTVIREPSATAAARFSDTSLDWIYIDGDHRYDAVRQDLELYFPKLRIGGYIVCDDYHYAGNFGDGVTRAVDEFMARRMCRKVFKRRSQFVMRKLSDESR
jgi:predicted O-methyltransferase YrrM